MNKTFYSNGKLLLTGEYVVLDGALSLSIPTKFGQSLTVEDFPERKLIWKSLDVDGNTWFEYEFDLELFCHSELVSESQNAAMLKQVQHDNKGYFDKLSMTVRNDKVAITLFKILLEAKKQNPNFLTSEKGYKITTKLGFDRNWGLGSSSTLINNIAQWSKMDAFELLWSNFSGSGYDIAAAQRNKPFTYQLLDGKPIVNEVDFSPPFADQLYFVYLNKKQNSNNEIAQYEKHKIINSNSIDEVNAITSAIISCKNVTDFEKLLAEHEKLMASIIKITPIKEKLFSDYFGELKSLGAWGGDFILATGNETTVSYFKNKGFKVVVPYKEMVLI